MTALEEVSDVSFALYSEGEAQSATDHGSHKRKDTAPDTWKICQWNIDEKRDDKPDDESDNGGDEIARRHFTHPAIRNDTDIW